VAARRLDSRKDLFVAGSHPGSGNGNTPRREIPPGDSTKKESLFLPIACRGVNTLEIIWHARERMRERGITQDDVLRTLESPDEERRSEKEAGRWEAFWNKTATVQIKVVFEPKPDRIRVISTSKKQRRLSGR
jgi:hypothetical protein